jgi:hypothetical protein
MFIILFEAFSRFPHSLFSRFRRGGEAAAPKSGK